VASVERIIGPLPGLKEARAISTLALIAGAILCVASLYFGFRGETFMGRPLGGDFVQFYSAGKILNTGPAAGIYDISTIVRVEHESLPTMPDTQMLLYGNAPYIAALFRPLALLPYRYAYCVWLGTSLLLYSAALLILIGDRLPKTAYLLALSSPLFLLETWIGGQISVIAFLGFALFVDCFRRERWFLAGLSLSIAAYKPSLIAIPAVMLIIGACWRAVAGVIAGSALAGVLSVATVGFDGCLRWIDTLRVFGLLATGDQASIRRIKYVDFNSFFSILFGAHGIARVCALVATGVVLLLLARASWKSSGDRRQLLAATLALMLVASFYVPVYDTIILATAAVLAAESNVDRKQFQLWLLALYLVPFVTQFFAEFAHVQILTPLLAGFGLWLLWPQIRADASRSRN
jgi:glycosyl transferase family 87